MPSLAKKMLARTAGKKPPQQTAEMAANNAWRAGSNIKEAIDVGGGASVATVKDLDAQIKILQAATRNLTKAHGAGAADASERGAAEVQLAAERILGNLPKMGSSKSKVLQAEARIKQLEHIVADTQLILDHQLVRQSKEAAAKIYMQAGRNSLGGQDKDDPTVPGFKHLSTRAGFVEASSGGALDTRRQAAKDMGLSDSDWAAIVTFTDFDYKYINPATANSRSWMQASMKDPIDDPNAKPGDLTKLKVKLRAAGKTLHQHEAEREQNLKTMSTEGALHTAFAVQGLQKLPEYSGQVFRGERISQAEFDAWFKIGGREKPIDAGDARLGGKPGYHTQRTMRSTRSHFVKGTMWSTSKKRDVADGFSFDGDAVSRPIRVIYDIQSIAGRYTAPFSQIAAEEEVTTLPGATFKIHSADLITGDYGNRFVFVKCTQTK